MSDANLRNAGIYAAGIQQRLKQQKETTPVIPLPRHVLGGIRDSLVKTKQCNCKRSNCLKLYCECFAAGIHCSVLCNCIDCKNNGDGKVNEDQRRRAVHVILERNPHAFRPKIVTGLGGMVDGQADYLNHSVNIDVGVKDQGSSSSSRTRGCNCKKSSCLKKYCECFQASVYCSVIVCKCRDCKNIEGNEEREALTAKMRKNSTEQMMQSLSGGNGGLIVSSADMFLPPSTFAVPLHFEGAEAPAISFGTTGGNRVEMIVKEPIKLEKVRKKKINEPMPKEKQQIRNADDVVIETDLERRWRVSREETCELLCSMMGKGYCDKLSPARKRRASEITDNVKRTMKEIIIGADNAKKSVTVSLETAKSTVTSNDRKAQHTDSKDEEKSLTQVPARQEFSSLTSSNDSECAKAQGVSKISADLDNDLKCSETIDSAGNDSRAPSRDLEILAAQKVAILQQLAVTVKSAALRMAEERLRRQASNQQGHR